MTAICLCPAEKDEGLLPGGSEYVFHKVARRTFALK